jgi:DNA topoisomerase-1
VREIEKERGTGGAMLRRDKPSEKLVGAIDRLEEKIRALKLQMVDRVTWKEVAFGTTTSMSSAVAVSFRPTSTVTSA